MNIIIPLILGILIGYLLRGKVKVNTESLMSASVVLLVLLMGMKAGSVEIRAIEVLKSSLVITIMTIAGSLILAKITWRD
ncbi:hypothetical protein PNA2_1287 [Pyrococcus sp. NA2]|uniref:LysO family transporter n=1 Tax=Pyrococcus sp. (strain NA2) TaxID=342949 RepID=UPI000209AD57|nr:LysO family transporter [Pyrococcus sp. NA2]AEC52202.1 hypothetical protein PNA2_1287 [Pyrococcus sp. NA2]